MLLDAVAIGLPAADWLALPADVRDRMREIHNATIREARRT